MLENEIASLEKHFQEAAHDPEKLKNVIKYSMAVIRLLSEETEKDKKLIEKILKEKALMEQQRLDLQDRLMKLRKLTFGRGPERATRTRSDAEAEVLLFSKELFPDPRERKKNNFEPINEIHGADEEELKQAAAEYTGKPVEECTGEEFKEMPGFFDESFEYVLIDRKIIKIKHQKKKYKLSEGSKNAEQAGEDIIITAPGPVKLAPKCTYSVDFALSVVMDKYNMHLPLHRQSREFERLGLQVGTKTLSNLCAMVANHLQDVEKNILRELIASPMCLHMDETPWPVNVGKNGFMWGLSSSLGAYYRFEPTRSGDIAAEILKNFNGVILTDDFSGYGKLKDLPMKKAACWSHARRKFFDIKQNYPPTVEILKLMDELFTVERKAKSWDELKVLRENESKVCAEKIYDWLLSHEHKYLPQSEMRRAINYSLHLWEKLTLFLIDIRVPLSNNDAERMLRHAVVGRKNFYGSQTINGADTAATIYTIIETCRRHNVEAREFMRSVIENNWKRKRSPTPIDIARQRSQAPLAA